MVQASRGRDQPGETVADFGVRSFSSGPFRLHDGVSSRSDTPNVVGPQVDAVSALQFSDNPMAFLSTTSILSRPATVRENAATSSRGLSNRIAAHFPKLAKVRPRGVAERGPCARNGNLSPSCPDSQALKALG